MQEQVEKYLSKLISHGLVENNEYAGLYGLDDRIYTNREIVPPEVRSLFDLLNINSLIIARPEPNLFSLIQDLICENHQLICPCDCESLTFIHDIPIIDSLDVHQVAAALNRRKGCIVKDTGIITTGMVSLEQAFISFSSFCFACFVKYFSDILNGLYGFCNTPRPETWKLDSMLEILSHLAPRSVDVSLSREVPSTQEQIIHAMDAAGKAIVSTRLVDSFFGNISYRHGNMVYISQTGSSLDELPGCIDCVPMDGSSTCDLTSSSELMAHVRTYELTRDSAILHGHPKFSVIMSMFGEPLDFEDIRFIENVPVVSGEVGAGRHGLMHTLPPVMQKHNGAIVYGHGTFTRSAESFHDAFETLYSIEHLCFNAYRKAILDAGIV
jgi:ribulose-5-phosphate 4-epimerase/fuculose-1-phosphate aldolase